MNLNPASMTLAVLAGVIGFVQWKRRRTPKTVGVLFLIAGFGIASGAGLLGNLLTKLGAVIGQMTTAGTAKAFGVSVPIVLVVGVGWWIGHDLWPSQRPSRALPVLALAFPTLLAVCGGVWASIGGDIVGGLGTMMSELTTAFLTGGA